MEHKDIPIDAPQDAIMAGPEEIQAMQNWVSVAFADGKAPGRESSIGVELRRQDYGKLGFGQSCRGTPIKIGQRQFEHGLGTHANSEIILSLPVGAREFDAFVGIDNNPDTGGTRGSVQFSVEITGKEVFRSQTLTGTNEPLAVKITLPEGTRQITLKTDTTPDGSAYDHADWADACILADNGRICWADEDRAPQPLIAAAIPFSFRYGGEGSSALMRDWQKVTASKEGAGRTTHQVSWTDPKTALRVSAAVVTFDRYAAAEWVLNFENLGAQDTPLIEDVQALDVQLRTSYREEPVRLHQLLGDLCSERSFLPQETEIEEGKPLTMAPSGGRSSSGAFPFFNVQYGEEGLIAAIGWSGQWRASIERPGGAWTGLRAGLEKTSLRLHPGEKIRMPRILLLPWRGDRQAAHNRFRRLVLFEYLPHRNGRPVPLPIALQSYDRYIDACPEWGTEPCQLRVAKAAHEVGCDTHWLDAAWFEGGFPNGVGNWFCPPQRLPNGLKRLSDACHEMGLKFLVWFEPERVAAGTRIAREHPDFILTGERSSLYKLNDPAARRWLGDLLSRLISDFGVDIYRNDFNIAPLGYWRRADAPERQGLTEIQYVEGHYELWDELLARHPGLAIDNCASGGTRIDLETCRRAVPLWHSDTGCSPGHADWNQTQIYGLSLYLPLFGACAWTPEAYDARSAGTAGLICQFAVLDENFPWESARAAVSEAKENQKYWYGDFYPLTPCVTGPGALLAYQLHRSDLDSGMALAFRRSECPYPILQTGLYNLNPKRTYAVEFIDEARAKEQRTMLGKDLMSDLELRLPKRGSSLLIRYKPLPGQK